LVLYAKLFSRKNFDKTFRTLRKYISKGIRSRQVNVGSVKK